MHDRDKAQGREDWRFLRGPHPEPETISDEYVSLGTHRRAEEGSRSHKVLQKGQLERPTLLLQEH